MRKIELLLPAGNADCLRAAVANGADAVYLGMRRFNARGTASNFTPEALSSVIGYCHAKNVKVYVALNILIKNNEISDFLYSADIANSSGADAIIIQDPCLIPLLKNNFPKLTLHLSTQAGVMNSYSIPDGAERVILARELPIKEISEISKMHETEVFVHGALCFSYSGQCLFSSMVGGRSGNRGMCAQPCRKKYNNKFLMSTMDLCTLERLPDILSSGVSALKVEGRMRSPYYVGTVARIYRKYIDKFYSGTFKIDPMDITELKLAFNREFTEGWAFTDTVVDARMGKNRGLFLGKVTGKELILREDISSGDGIRIVRGEEEVGKRIESLDIRGKVSAQAKKGDPVHISGTRDGDFVYKTSRKDASISLGEPLVIKEKKVARKAYRLQDIEKRSVKDKPKIFARAYNTKDAMETPADVIYFDILDDAIFNLEPIRDRLYAKTPRFVSDKDIDEISNRIKKLNPRGVLVSNRGFFDRLKGFDLHIDYCLNAFNDIDLQCLPGLPIISPELTFEELRAFRNRDFIVFSHGDVVLMASREIINKRSISDEEGRTFPVRQIKDGIEILNSRKIGLFSLVSDCIDAGIRYFYIDIEENLAKYVGIYRKIISGEVKEDRKLRKGYTTGHFKRGVL